MKLVSIIFKNREKEVVLHKACSLGVELFTAG